MLKTKSFCRVTLYKAIRDLRLLCSVKTANSPGNMGFQYGYPVSKTEVSIKWIGFLERNLLRVRKNDDLWK